MRKGVLIFGLIYTVAGVFSVNVALRLSSVYSQFGAQLPFITYLAIAFYILLPVFGLIQIIIYLAKFGKEKLYKTLFWVDVIFLVLAFTLFTTAVVMPIYNLSTSSR